MQGTPRSRAARASAAPWLPDECVATPRAASAGERDCTALHAPRNLNAPTRWKFSHLKKSFTPDSASREEAVRTGVRRANGRMRSAALRTSARVGRSASDKEFDIAVDAEAVQPRATRALRKSRSQGPSPSHSGGHQECWIARNTRSGCGIMMSARPSVDVSPATPPCEPFGFSG